MTGRENQYAAGHLCARRVHPTYVAATERRRIMAQLHTECRWTLSEIARYLGITRERVRQIVREEGVKSAVTQAVQREATRRSRLLDPVRAAFLLGKENLWVAVDGGIKPPWFSKRGKKRKTENADA